MKSLDVISPLQSADHTEETGRVGRHFLLSTLSFKVPTAALLLSLHQAVPLGIGKIKSLLGLLTLWSQVFAFIMYCTSWCPRVSGKGVRCPGVSYEWLWTTTWAQGTAFGSSHFVCVHAYVYLKSTGTKICTWGAENNFREWVLSTHHTGPSWDRSIPVAFRPDGIEWVSSSFTEASSWKTTVDRDWRRHSMLTSTSLWVPVDCFKLLESTISIS